MGNEPFLRPRLTGERFKDHTIPLEFLKDLAVLEEMFIEVAKAEFLKDHPDRQRSPRGFTDGIELKLTGVEEGSAIPVITLAVAALTLLPSEGETYILRARDSVVSAIDAAEQNQSITQYLPEKSLSYFDRIGRSLRDGEAMEFGVPNREQPAKLTKETRKKLVWASSKTKVVTEETIVRGLIPEADQDDMTFEIQTVDGKKLQAPLSQQHLDTILEAFLGYKSGGPHVMIQGIGRFDRSDRLVGLDTVEHVGHLDPLDIHVRLDELRLLKRGWLEGVGLPPSRQGLDWLADAFDQHYPEDAQLPYLFPTEEGGVMAEWSIDNNEISLEIDLVTHSATWHTLNSATDEAEEEIVDLNDETQWSWIADQIKTKCGGKA